MKNKKMLSMSIISIILLTGIILGILYFTTDLFKTEQELFYKYITKINIMDANLIDQIKDSNDKISKNSNSSTTTMDVNLSIPNQETGVADIQNLLKIKSNGLENPLLKQSYRDYTLSSNNQDLLTLKYIRDDNTYGIGADNILAKYLAVENANLKNLFAKLGADTTNIPDTIPNYEEILKIDEQTLTKLKETYGMLIYNNVNEANFYKVANEDGTETIGVSLTEQEVINILRLFLETAKNDTVLLNLIVSKAQLLNYANITIENIQTEIQNLLDENATNTYSTEKDFIKISMIKKQKNILKLILENSYTKANISNNIYPNEIENIPTGEKVNNKIEIDFSEMNKVSILIKENDKEIAKTIINYSYNDNNINFAIETQSIVEEEINTIKMQYQIENHKTDNIKQNFLINANVPTGENYQINIVNDIVLKQDVQISKLTTENSAKLNNMSAEELNNLFTALGNRITTLYGESIMNNTYNDNLIQNTQSPVDEYGEHMEQEEEITQNYQNTTN